MAEEEPQQAEIQALREKLASWSPIMEKISSYSAPDLWRQAGDLIAQARAQMDDPAKSSQAAATLQRSAELMGQAILLEAIF